MPTLRPRNARREGRRCRDTERHATHTWTPRGMVRCCLANAFAVMQSHQQGIFTPGYRRPDPSHGRRRCLKSVVYEQCLEECVFLQVHVLCLSSLSGVPLPKARVSKRFKFNEGYVRESIAARTQANSSNPEESYPFLKILSVSKPRGP